MCAGTCENTGAGCECQTSVINVKKISPITSAENSFNTFSINAKAKKSVTPSEIVEYTYNSEAKGDSPTELVQNIQEEIIVTVVDLIRNTIGQDNYPVVLPTFNKNIHLTTKQAFIDYLTQGDGSTPLTNVTNIGKVSYAALSLFGLLKRIEAHILTNGNLFTGNGLFSCQDNVTSRALKSICTNCLFDYEFVYN